MIPDDSFDTLVRNTNDSLDVDLGILNDKRYYPRHNDAVSVNSEPSDATDMELTI